MSGRFKKTWRLEVVWEDSQIELAGWTPVRRLLKRRRRVRCRSVGFVLADDKLGVILAGSVNGPNATGVVCIPARQIVSRRRLIGRPKGRSI